MTRPCDHRTIFTVLIASMVLPLLPGIVAGLVEDWMRMSLCLFSSTLMAFFTANTLLLIRLKTYFKHLENRFPGDFCQSPNTEGFATRILPVLMVVFVPIWMSLSIIAVSRQDPFWLGVSLFACGVTVIVGTDVPIILKITLRLKHLDRLIPDSGKESQGQPPQLGSKTTGDTYYLPEERLSRPFFPCLSCPFPA